MAYLAYWHPKEYERLERQAYGAQKTFEASIETSPFVLQCWLVSADYLIKCVATDLCHMHLQKLLAGFAAMPDVRNVKSLMALRAVKDAPLQVLTPVRGKSGGN